MISTGNDIVALGAINVDRTKQPNFYSKIITDNEKSLYDKALFAVLPLEHFVWLAWSVKESVYKFLQRHQHGLVFSPSRIVVEQVVLPEVDKPNSIEDLDDSLNYHGVAIYAGRRLYYRSILKDDYIFSVVNNSENFDHVFWGVRKIGSTQPEDQSTEARNMVLDTLASLLPGNQFKIEKSLAGYPIVIKNGSETDIPVSFAHHDHFVGYSFVLKLY
jgi:phosphopantetheinyl transferase (holo-ACP synthase)